MGESKSDVLGYLQDTKIRAYAESVTGSSDAADDVLQAVAEKLLRSEDVARTPRNFLFTAIKNIAIDSFRSNERRQKREESYATLQSRKVISPEKDLENKQLGRQIDRAIREMPILSQYLFVNFYINGKTQQALAFELDLHTSTIEKRLAKARKHCLKSLLAFK